MSKAKFCSKGHDIFVYGKDSQGHCRGCSNSRSRIWYKNNPLRAKKTMQKWYLKNKKKARQMNKLWQLEHPVNIRNSHWKYRGVLNQDGTPFVMENYLEAFADQKGRCAICHIDHKRLQKSLHVDHDHKTGFFRGLLCATCNNHLGLYEKKKDSFFIYLEDSRRN